LVERIEVMGTCKCCTGSGIQILFNGEKIYCKACGGTGKRIDLSPVPYIPVSPPHIRCRNLAHGTMAAESRVGVVLLAMWM